MKKRDKIKHEFLKIRVIELEKDIKHLLKERKVLKKAMEKDKKIIKELIQVNGKI